MLAHGTFAAPSLQAAPRRAVRRVRASAGLAAPGEEEEAEACRPAAVFVTDGPGSMNKLTIEVSDFPGHLRVVAWTLNGLGVEVHDLALLSTADGVALDTFTVAKRDGSAKLSPMEAADIVERLESTLNSCTARASEPQQLRCGDVCVSSPLHEDTSVVTVAVDPHSRSKQLLQLATQLSGLGYAIKEAGVEKEAWVFRVQHAGRQLTDTEGHALLYLLTNSRSSTVVPF